MSEAPDQPAARSPHQCIVCDKVFATRYGVVRHALKAHSVDMKKKATFKCDQCHRAAFGHRNRLLSHLSYEHGFVPNYQELKFRSREEFLAWKDEEEYREKVHFVAPCSHKVLYGGRLKRYYLCHRSGVYVGRGSGKRKLKSQGSCKVGTHCMATMVTIEMPDTGSVSVVYQKQHYGHDIDLGHVRLSKAERQVVTNQLLQGIPPSDILQNVRGSVGRQLSKIHLMTRKDLHNILKVSLGCTLKQFHEQVQAGLIPTPIKAEPPDDSADADEFLGDIPGDGGLVDDCLADGAETEMVLNSVASLACAQGSAKQRLFDAIRELCGKVGTYSGDDDRLVQVEQQIRCFSQMLDSRAIEEVLVGCNPSGEDTDGEAMLEAEDDEVCARRKTKQRHDHVYSKTMC
ncbi:unnamed protein product [Ixodes hexagonus]